MGLFDAFKKSSVPKTPAAPVPSSQSTNPPAKTSPPAAPPPPANPPVAAASAVEKTPVKPPRAAKEPELKRRILFVATDRLWFHRVEGQMVELEPDWFCWWTESADEAGKLLDASGFDSIVLDGDTPDAAKLFEDSRNKIAEKICLVRCDLSDRAGVGQWTKSGAIPVGADGEAGALVASLRRAERVREWMGTPAIKKLLPQIRKLPAEPKLYVQVTEELQSESGSMMVVGRMISQDPLMAAKMLQMVNSAFFGLVHEVSDTAEAVMMLGTERVKSLVLLAGVFSQYDGVKCSGFSLEAIWDHSLWVGVLARSIALGETSNVKTADMAFTAGLFHDLGKLVLAANLPDLFGAVKRMQAGGTVSQRTAERAVLGTTHAELGACLLATWGLPLPILEAIAWHHEPERSNDRGFSLLAAVHVANVLAQENGHSGGGDGGREGIRLEFLEQAGLGDCRDRWRNFCGITPPQSGTAAPPKPS